MKRNWTSLKGLHGAGSTSRTWNPYSCWAKSPLFVGISRCSSIPYNYSVYLSTFHDFPCFSQLCSIFSLGIFQPCHTMSATPDRQDTSPDDHRWGRRPGQVWRSKLQISGSSLRKRGDCRRQPVPGQGHRFFDAQAWTRHWCTPKDPSLMCSNCNWSYMIYIYILYIYIYIYIATTILILVVAHQVSRTWWWCFGFVPFTDPAAIFVQRSCLLRAFEVPGGEVIGWTDPDEIDLIIMIYLNSLSKLKQFLFITSMWMKDDVSGSEPWFVHNKITYVWDIPSYRLSSSCCTLLYIWLECR